MADTIKGALGVDDDKDKKDKDDKDGGFLSIFKKDKDEKEDDDDGNKGGLFSFGKDKDRDRDKDDDKGNFFQKIFKRDDDEDDDREKVPKKSGFAGLFSEQDQPGAVRFEEGATEGGGPCDHMTEGDLDLMSDLMEVAKES